MDRRILSMAFPLDAGLEFNGERYIPGVRGQLQYEHFHRYLAAAPHVIGKQVLDIACGEGYGSFGLAQLAESVCGVDIATEAISHARSKYQSPNLRFVKGSIAAIPFDDSEFDVVVCLETIEHVTEQEGAVAELRRVLRPDGLMIISSPNARAADDAWHEENPFHEKELTFDAFRSLLTPHFAYIRFAEQRFLHGSLVAEMGSLSDNDERARFESDDNVRYAARRGHWTAPHG